MNNKLTSIFVLFTITILVFSSYSKPVHVDIPVSDDAYVQPSRDGCEDCSSQTYDGGDIWLTPGSFKTHGFLGFPLNDIPDNANIYQAELHLPRSTTLPGTFKSFAINVYRILNNLDWSENSVTWDNQPECEKEKIGLVNALLEKPVPLDITDAVRHAFHRPKKPRSVGFKLASALDYKSFKIPSKDSMTNEEPYIRVLYDDEACGSAVCPGTYRCCFIENRQLETNQFYSCYSPYTQVCEENTLCEYGSSVCGGRCYDNQLHSCCTDSNGDKHICDKQS
jgi:hypothetical protein